MDEQSQTSDAPFTVDPSYVLRQTEERLLLEVKAHVLTKAGFEQVMDMHNQRVMQIRSLEAQVAQLREEMREHEKLAVDQQVKIDEYEEFKKLLEADGSTNFNDLFEDLRRIHTPKEPDLSHDPHQHTEE